MRIPKLCKDEARRFDDRRVAGMAGIVMTIALWGGASAFADGVWPQFRGPGGMGAGEGNPPVQWDASNHVAWKAELPGAGSSSAVVWGDAVYLTCHTGYGVSPENPGKREDLVRHLLCFGLEDGQLRWSREVRSSEAEAVYESRMHWHGYATNTPAVDKDGVYCFFGSAGLHAFTHEGEPRWTSSAGEGSHEWGSAASPVLHGDLVLLNAFVESGSMVALDRRTGKEVWRYEGLREAWNTPIVAAGAGGKSEVALGVWGKIVGVDAATGAELWSCAAADWYIVASPLAHDGVIYSLSGKGFEAATAVRGGGQGDVTETHRIWQTRKGSNVSSPVLVDGHLYFAHDQGSFFYCLNAGTGEVVYQDRLPGRFGEVYSSPATASGRIYLFSREGGAVVIAAKPEFEVLAENPQLDRSPVNASPAVVGDSLLIRSDRYLYRLAE